MSGTRASASILIALFAAGCASLAPLHCGPGTSAHTLDTLYFGTAHASGAVTAVQWRAFVDAAVTPRFPDGLTSWTAVGQWRGASGVIEREAAHVLQLLHAGGDAQNAAIASVMRDYRERFAQEAVLRVSTPVCAEFSSE